MCSSALCRRLRFASFPRPAPARRPLSERCTIAGVTEATNKPERRLAAIFAADVAGYSRLMSQDEAGTLRSLTSHREIMDRLIAEHRGRIANTAGDSVLAEFPSVVDAVECAAEVQERLREANAGVPEDRRLEFRIGLHVGDVVVRGGDLLGDGVNIAARVQSLAENGGVWVSEDAHRYLGGKTHHTFADRGEQQVKNIAQSVRVYALVKDKAANTAESPPQSARPSIAVLPFDNLSGDPADEYFSHGMTEDIITSLTRIRWFHVVARNSVFGYKRQARDIRRVAHDLGATYVLEGSVRKAGERLRLTAQLIDGGTGNHIWAQRYDRELNDIFAVQDDLTGSIVATVEPELSKAERDRARSRASNLTAWDLYQKGVWHLYRRRHADLSEALRLFDSALMLEPELVPALCAASEAYYFRIVFGYT